MVYIRIKGKKNRNYQGFFNNFPEKFQKHLKFTENYLKSQNSKKARITFEIISFLRDREKKKF